jgi:hypothetical protein
MSNLRGGYVEYAGYGSIYCNHFCYKFNSYLGNKYDG